MASAPKSDTWMPLYIADYLSDTAHLTTEQHGAYMLLLMASWKRGGRLPGDDGQLAAICRLPPRTWRAHAAILRTFFREDGGDLVQGRVEREFARAREITEKRRQAGLQGGRPPSQTESKLKANGFANGKQNETPARVALPSPSQVVQLPESPEKAETQQNGQAVRGRGNRLPSGWEPSADGIIHAIKEGFSDTEAFRMVEDFRDFWQAKSGQDARKVDWPATWRRWVREEAKRRPHRHSAPQKRVGWV